MKRIITLSFCVASLYAGAQNVKLETGKTITGVTKSDISMDMGIGGQMKINSSTTTMINVTGTDANGYKAETSVTKMKMSEEGAGQDINYDSEKKEDADSEIGKEVGKGLNVKTAVLIDKNTGAVTDASPEKAVTDDDGNPFGEIMGTSKASATGVTPAFLVIPAGKKTGDKWMDSTSEKGMKVVKNYELQSLTGEMATILLKAATSGTMTKEANGMQMDITMKGMSESTITTNSATGLVKKNTTKTNMEGTLDMMGQSIPITMEMSSVSTFE